MKHISEYIDHTSLKPHITYDEMHKFVVTANKYRFASVCIPPSLVKWIYNKTNASICTVIGFPFGFISSGEKIFEIGQSLCNGVDEIDIVLNISNIVNDDWDAVDSEIKDVTSLKTLAIKKIIVETCYLTEEQLEIVTKIIVRNDVDYIKTSTGYGTRGASVRDIEIIKSVIPVGSNLKIKASGGIKTLEDAEKFINLGCERIGTSNGANICAEWEKKYGNNT